MRKNIRCIRGNASISIFYDTIFCFGRIYSRDWYLAKRNIAVCQIKATTAIAAQQQLHLKGCDVVVADFYASESLAEHVTSYRYTNYTPHYGVLTRQLSGIQGFRRLLRTPFYGTVFARFDTEEERLCVSTTQWWAENSTDCTRECLVDNKTDLDYIVTRDWIYKICCRSGSRRRIEMLEFRDAAYLHPLRMTRIVLTLRYREH